MPYCPAPFALASTVVPFGLYTVSFGASRLRPLLWTSSSTVLPVPAGAVNEKYSDCPALVMSRFGTSAVRPGVLICELIVAAVARVPLEAPLVLYASGVRGALAL